MICCEKLWGSISREWLVRPIRACWTLVPILCQSHRQIWMSPNVTGQNHLPWTCSVPRISHALSHQTVRFTTTRSLSFPTSFTGPCARFVPSTKHLFSTPSNTGNHYLLLFPSLCFYCHLFACFLYSGPWKKSMSVYHPLITTIVREACFHLKWQDLSYRAERNPLAPASGTQGPLCQCGHHLWPS